MSMKESTATSGQLDSSNPLAKKLSKALSSQIDTDKDICEVLKALSLFVNENNIRSRRRLRSAIEQRNLFLHEEFLSEFGEIATLLDAVSSDIDDMNSCCQDMSKRLQETKSRTRGLIDHTARLRKDQQEVEMKLDAVSNFIDKYQLSNNDATALKNGPESNPLLFFEAVMKAKRIHDDAKSLLRSPEHGIALEIMEEMALQLEAAYERLYRWCQSQCRLMTGDSPDVSKHLPGAFSILADRPALFRYGLDEYANVRRLALVHSFVDALTKGGPGSHSMPIEILSHNPLRYSGDMLAWLYQGVASERELLHILLAKTNNVESGLNSDSMQSTLASITDGICRRLKMRIEQVIVSEPGPVLLHRLSGLLKFYQIRMAEFLSEDSLLVLTVKELQELSWRLLLNCLQTSLTSSDQVELPPHDLQPLPSVSKAMHLLDELLSGKDMAIVPLSERQTDIDQLIRSIIDPLMNQCNISASQLNSGDMAAFLINCLQSIKTRISPYEFTGAWIELLSNQIDAHLETLVNEQAYFVLKRTQFAELYRACCEHSPDVSGPLSSKSGLDSQSLIASVDNFDRYLANPDRLIMPQCSLLLSPSLRDRVKTSSIELLNSAYTASYTAIMNPQNNFSEELVSRLRHPDDVKNLFAQM